LSVCGENIAKLVSQGWNHKIHAQGPSRRSGTAMGILQDW